MASLEIGHGLRSSFNSYRKAILGDTLAKHWPLPAICAVAMALLVLASCGGGASTSSTPPPPPPAAPAITRFAPASGPVGTLVTITGYNFTSVTAVTLNGAPLQFTAGGITQLSVTIPASASSGLFSVASPSGNATSAGRFWVTASSDLDLTIDGMYVTQATQTYPEPHIALIKNRSAFIRVFARANKENTAAPDVRVRFVNGTSTNSLTISAPAASVPTYVDRDTIISWNAPISADWIQPNVQVIADLDPSNAIAEADESNNQFIQTLSDVRSLEQFKLTLFPVRTKDGLTGVIQSADRTPEDWVDFMRRVYPVPDDIDVAVGSIMYSSVSQISSSDDSWLRVVNEVAAKRAAEGVTDRYYAGVVKTNYTSGTAGRSIIGSPVVASWDGNLFDVMLAHEIGHNFNRSHTPCGNPSGTDPSYPYPLGNIGTPGWDVFAASDNLKSAYYNDIMSYCPTTPWISDYTYTHVLDFRDRNRLISQTSTTAPQEGLLVWGRIENGRTVLEPAFRVPVSNSLPAPGPYTWEARDADGATLATISFDAPNISDGLSEAPARIFSFVVPLAPETINAIQSLHIRKDKRELASIVRPIAAALQSMTRQDVVRVEPSSDDQSRVSWDANRYPMLMLRDAQTGEVRGFLRAGTAAVTVGLEIHASDGVQSQVIQSRSAE